MKTVTEFPGILLRQAADIQRAFKASQPAPEPAPAAEAPTDEERAAPESSEGEAAPAAEAAPAEPAAGTGPDAEAVGEGLQVSGDRLARLMEALSVVGNRVGAVRLVRVLSGDKPPPNAQKRGDFYYVVDLVQKGQP